MRNDFGLLPTPGKTYKVFFVEVDDEDRERVLFGLADEIVIDTNVEYDRVYSENYMEPVHRFISKTDVTCTLKLLPRDDGTYFTIENFMEEE